MSKELADIRLQSPARSCFQIEKFALPFVGDMHCRLQQESEMPEYPGYMLDVAF